MKKPVDLDKMIDSFYKKKENKFDADSLLEEVGKVLEKYMGYEAKRDYADFPIQEEPYGVAKDFPLLSAGDPRIERNDSDEYNPMDNAGLAGPASSGRSFMMPENSSIKPLKLDSRLDSALKEIENFIKNSSNLNISIIPESPSSVKIIAKTQKDREVLYNNIVNLIRTGSNPILSGFKPTSLSQASLALIMDAGKFSTGKEKSPLKIKFKYEFGGAAAAGKKREKLLAQNFMAAIKKLKKFRQLVVRLVQILFYRYGVAKLNLVLK
jgi:hypothetical protein